MLSAEDIKKIDPSLSSTSEQDITELLREMYETVDLFFDIWWQNKQGSKNPTRLFQKDDIKNKIKPCLKSSKKQP